MTAKRAIKNDFPIFRQAKTFKPWVYLDSAATAQKPKAVIEAEKEWYEKYNANIHRGIYHLSEQATELIEAVRQKVSAFIGAGNSRSIVFTSGTTDGINLVAQAWARHYLKKDDVILLTEMEHHANLVPWQKLAGELKLDLRFWPIDQQGRLKLEEMDKLFQGAKLLAITQVSNVLGTVNPLQKIIKEAHRRRIRVVVDAAQSVPHFAVNMKRLKADFFIFSAHKMLGPTGVGMVYINPELFAEVKEYRLGGGMIREVSKKKASFTDLPWRLEAGTLPLAQIFALGKAIDYLENIGMVKIMRHDQLLTKYTYQKLLQVNGVRVIGPAPKDRCGLVSFVVDDIHPHDLATWLDQYHICVRAGHHCAMPLHQKLKLPATVRASFYIYNDRRDIDIFIRALKRIISQWGREG